MANLQVLVVDDDEFSREVAAGLLKAVGCDVTEANDGNMAVALVRAADYALILMDMQMPDTSGLDIARQIRALGPRGTRPLICSMTGTAMAKDDFLFCRQAGIDAHISKPVTRETLVSLLSRLSLA